MTSHTPPVRVAAAASLRKSLGLVIQETYGEGKVELAKVDRGWHHKDKKSGKVDFMHCKIGW